MTDTPDPTRELWDSVLVLLHADDRVTPQLQGFLNLVEPKGVLAGTLYLEVPNELTRGMLDQRIRVPLLNALSTIDEDHGITNFAIVVNPEIQHAGLSLDSDTAPREELTREQSPVVSQTVGAGLTGTDQNRR